MATSRMDRVVFEAFYVRVDGPPKRRGLAAVRVRRALGPGVKLERLGDGRGLLATPRRRLAPGAAWQKARELQDELAKELGRNLVVEPLFAVTHTGPPIGAPRKHGRQAKSVGKKCPTLDCATHDCDWSLDKTHVQSAWALPLPVGGEAMGKGILIGHPDTGYTRHDELFPKPPGTSRVRVDLGYDFEKDDPDPYDPLKKMDGHGTGTASVIMSDSGGLSPTKFVTGVAPAAELVPLRVSNGVVHFSFSDVTRAIHYAIDRAKVHVISMSLGGGLFGVHALEDAVDRAIAKDIVVLAAAGNEVGFVVYPARFPQVIAVAATNCCDEPWSGSSHGPRVDLSAPGEAVWRATSTHVKGAETYDVGPGCGTSYAVATVAGACALWLAFHGRDTLIKHAGKGRLAKRFDIVVRLTSRVPAGWNQDEYGAGILDAHALLQFPVTAAVPKHMKARAKKLAKAKAQARAAVGPARDPAALVAEYFAPSERSRALARLERRLGTTPTARAKAWKRLGPEIVFHVATDDGLRRRLAAPAPKGKGKKKVKGKAAAPVHVARASSELRAVLEH